MIKGVGEMSFKGSAKEVQDKLETLLKLFGQDVKIIDIQKSIIELRR